MRYPVLLFLASAAACAPRPLATLAADDAPPPAITGATVLRTGGPGELEPQTVFVRSARIVQPRVAGHGTWTDPRADAPDLQPRSTIAVPETASAVFP